MSNTHNMNATNTYTTDTVNTGTDNQGNVSMNTGNTLNALVDRTISIIDKGLDRNVGDMSLMQAMEFVGVLMDIRERQRSYEQRISKSIGACAKKPKRK